MKYSDYTRELELSRMITMSAPDRESCTGQDLCAQESTMSESGVGIMSDDSVNLIKLRNYTK